MNERRVNEPFDEQLEWDRDGQYYHYLTKWMHALDQVSRVTGEPRYNIWAIELAKRAHAGFVYVPPNGGRKSMYWKMSIDLSYPLVPSMGYHDPLDGLITYNQLKMTASKDFENPTGADLDGEISDMVNICQGKDWTTDDPLGIGGLLCDGFRVAQLTVRDHSQEIELLGNILDSSLQGLRLYEPKNTLKFPADYRLAFREFGLSIGLRAVEKLKDWIDQNERYFLKTPTLSSRIESLMRYLKFRDEIEMFWLDRTNRKTEIWEAHRDINTVMLATSLAPDGYLKLYMSHNVTKNRSTG